MTLEAACALRELFLVGVTAELCLYLKHAKELLRNVVGMDEVIGTQDLAQVTWVGWGRELQGLVMAACVPCVGV